MNVLKSEQEIITLQYGNQKLNGIPYKHSGIDFVKQGYQLDEIIACKKGKVINAEKNVPGYKAGSYGNFVHIQHGGNISTVYAHMKPGTVCVNIGDIVEDGQVIGYMGATGFVTGAHLHFEVRENNIPVDPNPYFKHQMEILPYSEQTQEKSFNIRVDKSEANVRSQATSKSGIAGTGLLQKGDIFKAVAIVEGENVNGNNKWYKSAKGNYVWSGGLTKI